LIPSKNNADVLDCCLKHVISAEPVDKEIIVVDAHSSDGTNEILRRYEALVKVVYDDGSTVTRARNLGVAHANGDIVVFLDTDTIVAPDDFKKYLAFYAAHPEVDALGTDGVNPVLGNKVQRLDSLYWRVTRGTGDPDSSLGGWNMSFRRNVLIRIGGFTGFLRSEDNDINPKMDICGVKHKKIHTRSWHFPRATLVLQAREQVQWGNNAAQAMIYYALQPLRTQNKGAQKHRLERKLESFTNHPMLHPIIVELIEPLAAINVLYKTKSFELYAYTVFRKAMNLLGYLRGLRVKRWVG
jgi:glycosyltransferase involved in cell wall biosynthesis